MAAYLPSDEQRQLIESDDSAAVIAGPGRGKSATAIAAAKAWLERHPGHGRVLFTSFSNAAVKRIAASAGIDLRQHTRRLRFRTFHSVAFEILQDYGRFVGLKTPLRVMDETEASLIASERDWHDLESAERAAAVRSLARREGMIGFDLMIPLASALLLNSVVIRRQIGRRFPFIVVDEFQDTTSVQWEFLKLLGESNRVAILGDPDQMIYERQHQIALARVTEFETWKGVQAIRFDGENYRCRNAAIIRFADALLHGNLEIPNNGDGVQLIPAYPNQRRAVLAAVWLAIRRQARPDSTIAFIVPSAASARNLAADLRAPQVGAAVAVPIHAHIETPTEDFDAFRLAAYAGADWLNAPCDERLKRFAMAIVIFMSSWSRIKVSGAKIETVYRRISPQSRAASPVREFLRAATAKPFEAFAGGLLDAMEQDSCFRSAARALRSHGLPRTPALAASQADLFDTYRQNRAITGLEGAVASRAQTSMVSMYRSKGREFDFVLLVVEPRSHSQTTSLDELRRLYYVSATRAKQWLGVLHVPNRCGQVLAPVIGQRP